MRDFLAENNICGQTILHLGSKGNAIVAEILRLKDYIPKTYRLETKQEVQKYGEIIMDFSYFKIADEQEQKIENNETLRDIDEEFRDNHIDIIKRFYLAFESIHGYIIDLNHYLDELEEGFYVHQTLETVFFDPEGKQILCEALYLYGLMLLLVDYHITGIIRERILVSYYRYTPQRRDTQSCIDEVCKLLRDTGFNTNKKPLTYPENYFSRIPLKSTYVDLVIDRLRSDDIYNQSPVYPLPKHRSVSLANQGSMLYVCLYFAAHILHTQTAIMREIVDKFFPDNWVISVYMGHIVNLAETWEPFKAAKLALNNTLDPSNVRDHAASHGSNVLEQLKTTSMLLKEGNISSQTLLKDINNIINTLRSCNVTIRWLMLHVIQVERNKKIKQLRDIVVTESKCDEAHLFKLLLNTAQLELTTKELFKSLLTQKEVKWEELRTESSKSIVELSEVFSGTKPLTRIQKNENLQLWFIDIGKKIDSLDKNDVGSSRKLVQLIQALEEVQEYHQLESNMQIIQFLSETRRNMDQMIRTMNIKEDVLINLQIVGDISYAWRTIDNYTLIMQRGIKKEPTLVIKLRAVFLKLASALEVPLLRINQARSDDMMSVSQYYSHELEIYIRKVLQIIPNMMFDKLSRIIEMQTSVLKEIPTRVDKDKLREYAQLDERFEFAELTHSISVFSQGMRMMKSTLVGVVCLDPKKLLEDGIRKELVQNISQALHHELIFNNTKSTVSDLEPKLKALGQIMAGYKRSFEYIQDYVNLNGLKIWQEEVTRIVNYNVEQECNAFLRYKIHPWQSVYQNRYVPIPVYPPIEGSVNFIGRLAREIIRLTDPRVSVYLWHTTSWYDMKTRKVSLNKEIIACITSAIEVAGLVGLDRLFSFIIITALHKIIGYLENKQTKAASWTNIINTVLLDMKQAENVENPQKAYQTYVNRTTKIWSEFLENILLVGQLQLLRNLIGFHLNKSCKFNAKNLESSLKSLNDSLLLDINKNQCVPSEDFLLTLSPYFDYVGLNKPFNKVYVTAKSSSDYSTIMFIFVLAHLQRLFFSQNLGGIAKKK